MKSIRTILAAATVAAIAGCTYVEPVEPVSTTREATTTTVDHATGEAVTTQRRTTHYPD